MCPYFLARDKSIDNAELIFMPYNYAIDPNVRASLPLSWHNAVVIFDEAHNIESVASSAASFDLSAGSLAAATGRLGPFIASQRTTPD